MKAISLLKEIHRVSSLNIRAIEQRVSMRKSVKRMLAPELTNEEKKAIKAYWGHYKVSIDYNAFRWYYALTGKHDYHFIPDDLYVKYILPKTNSLSTAKILSDKNLLDIFFPDVVRAETVFRNVAGALLDDRYRIISEDELKRKCSEEDFLFVKPSINSCQGKGIRCEKGLDISKGFDEFQPDYIVQKRICQHENLSKLNGSSVNVVRVTTYLDDQSVHVLCPIIRVGAPGNITDHGNIAIGINEDGTLCDYGFLVDGSRVLTTKNGYSFGKMRVPCFDKIKVSVVEWHQRISQIKLIGWDVTVDEKNRVVLIEANMLYPGLRRCQEANGPFFGTLTDEVLRKYLPPRDNNSSNT